MAAKFHERFDIEVGQEEARKRAVNKIHNIVFSSLTELPRYEDIEREILTALGDRWVSTHDFHKQVGDDFDRNLQAIEVLYQALDPKRWKQMVVHEYRDTGAEENKKLKYYTYQQHLKIWICRILEEAEVDLAIRWNSGQFIKSGAALLDERLVNDPLQWLRSSGYETVLTPFKKGLSHFLHASKEPERLADVVTDMYESLEALAKIITGRDRDLSANREMFLAKVKASDEYKQLLKDYIDYANKFRHAEGQRRPELSPKEVESFVYLTGVFIRLAMPSS